MVTGYLSFMVDVEGGRMKGVPTQGVMYEVMKAMQ